MAPIMMSYPDVDRLALGAAEWIAVAANEAVKRKGVFTLVLSGGQTPRKLYEKLALPVFFRKIPWGQIHFFWGDERFVSADDPRSNYRLAWESLLSLLPLLPTQIHRIPTECDSPQAAAQEYETSLKSFFGKKVRWPHFDCVLLGIGADGHTASLFPEEAALQEEKKWVTSVLPKQNEPARVTLTLPVLNHARDAAFLVSGAEKKQVVRDIILGVEKAEKYPATYVTPNHNELWFIDSEAASGIKTFQMEAAEIH